MGFDVSYVSAFVAGLLSFLSPCVLPIVPPYLCYLAGVGVNEARQDVSRETYIQLLKTATVFVLGFSTVFVALGATASVIGQVVSEHLDILSKIAGVLIIIMGVHFLGLVRIPILMREKRLEVDEKPAGLIGPYVMGLAFAFGWTPCVGPVLATILFIAGAEDTALQGAMLLLVYALGIGLPFIAVAAFIGPTMKLMSKYGKHIGKIEKAMGLLLVITGVLFLTGAMSEMAFWLLETFPALGKVG